jgi:POT family proton-dependent oligopeptide transporter
MSTTQTGHPKGLYVLFVTEMWERFSYYGMRALLALYMINALLLDKEEGAQIFGSYQGLVYLTPLIGGYMADNYWGNRKSIVIGGLLMACGQFFMFASGSMLENVDTARMLMYVGLACLIFGNGFFKPNISTMVGSLYAEGDKRRDAAFTIFYMGINLGAFIAPLVCGTLGEQTNADGGSITSAFKWGFLAAGIGMLVSVALFVYLRDFYVVRPDGSRIGEAPTKLNKTLDIDTKEELKSVFTSKQIAIWGTVAIVLLIIFRMLLDKLPVGDLFNLLFTDFSSFSKSYFSDINAWIGALIFSATIAAPGIIISDGTLTKIEKQRIWVIYIVAFFVIFFWAAFEQAGVSLTYFAAEQTDRNIGLHISKTVLTSIYALIILGLSLIGFRVYKNFNNERKGLKELILGLIIIINIILIYLIVKTPTIGYIFKEVPSSYFQSINAIAIVLFAPLFGMLWTALGKKNLEPASPYKQSIGLFLLAIGYLVIAVGVKDLHATTKVSMLWLLTLYTIHTFGELCLSPIGLSMVNKLAPLKFASLLMGVWFLSTATANKFAGLLSGYYPETMVKVQTIEEQQLNNKVVLCKKLDKAKEIKGVKYVSLDDVSFESVKDVELKKIITEDVFKNSLIKEKKFVGFKIDSLYSFFMLFVVMAGVASIILFFLSRKLVTMMNGVE